MGRPKATLLVDGETLAVRTARVLASVCDPVLEVGPGYTELPSVVEDPPGGGPVAALVAGWDALAGPTWVIVVACDLPFLEAGVVRALVEHPGTGTVVPVARGRRQHGCARYGTAARTAADGCLASGDASFRCVLGAVDAEEMDEVVWRARAGPRALVDVDTPADAARWGIGHPR